MAGVALVGIVLAGCGSASPSVPSVSPSLSGVPASADVIASANAGSSLPPTCSSAALEVRGWRMAGGTGTAHADLYFTNVGSTQCSLAGQPTIVEFLTADGAPIPITPVGARSEPLMRLVMRPPGAQAVAKMRAHSPHSSSRATRRHIEPSG